MFGSANQSTAERVTNITGWSGRASSLVPRSPVWFIRAFIDVICLLFLCKYPNISWYTLQNITLLMYVAAFVLAFCNWRVCGQDGRLGACRSQVRVGS